MLLMKYMDSFKTHLAKMDEISGSDLTMVISCVFEQLAIKNDVKGFYRIPSVFDCPEIPRISLSDYLNRYYVFFVGLIVEFVPELCVVMPRWFWQAFILTASFVARLSLWIR